ncbi:MAG: hypothetical protein ACT4PT_14425 [Methanobacteriota archaeon]
MSERRGGGAWWAWSMIVLVAPFSACVGQDADTGGDAPAESRNGTSSGNGTGSPGAAEPNATVSAPETAEPMDRLGDTFEIADGFAAVTDAERFPTVNPFGYRNPFEG